MKYKPGDEAYLIDDDNTVQKVDIIKRANIFGRIIYQVNVGKKYAMFLDEEDLYPTRAEAEKALKD